MKLSSQIEAILFYKAEPVSLRRLCENLERDESGVKEALIELRNDLVGGGLTLIEKDGEFMLSTSADVSPLIEKIAKEELTRDIGKAGLETLSIILYKNPVSRSEVDYIRGVNSSFIIRNLLIRGLVERIPNPRDSRSYLYRPTFDLLGYLGIEKLEDLPDRERVLTEISGFQKKSSDQEETVDGTPESNDAGESQ